MEKWRDSIDLEFGILLADLPRLDCLPHDLLIVKAVLKAVHQYDRHPSKFEVAEKYKDLNFSFSSVSLSNLQNELSLDSSRSVHETDTIY